MDATTMPSMNLLLDKLRHDFPSFHFTEDTYFAWSPENSTVHFHPTEENADSLLLHELSHGILEHQAYREDVTLLAMEAAAWNKAQELAVEYETHISDDLIEDNLDTYRDWLHARSTCPSCQATGYQTGKKQYACPACNGQWRVNEARVCGLKRYKV